MTSEEIMEGGKPKGRHAYQVGYGADTDPRIHISRSFLKSAAGAGDLRAGRQPIPTEL